MTPQPEERPIVIHGPLTGDPERIAAAPRSLPDVAPRIRPSTDVIGPMLVNPTTQPRARTEAPAAVVSAAPAERVFGLDAFRGFLLLAMNFTFTIPPWGPFAKWMYHTQVPPSPTAEYVRVAGLTWQDLLFAMFVFTMAAAIPIAMSGRLARGKPYPEIMVQALRRGALLLVLALLIGHVNPYWTQDYTKRGNVLALTGLLVAFAVFVQPPKSWSPSAVRILKRIGWTATAVLLFLVPLLYGQQFSFDRQDHIMAALAFTTVAGTALWLATRGRQKFRVLLFGLIVLARTLAQQFDAVGSIWFANPASWVYEPWYLDLLLLVIPGTIAGELIWRWMKRDTAVATVGWTQARLGALALLGVSFIPVLLVGLYERRYPVATTLAVFGLAGLLALVARKPITERDHVIAQMYRWSALLLVLGMLAEPLEGGIMKDPQTLGFLLLMAGTAMAALGSLMIAADIFRSGRRVLSPVALIGQNALFAYVIIMLGFQHILWLSGIGDAFTSTWQQATIRSVVLTGLAGIVVWAATRRRLIWKT